MPIGEGATRRHEHVDELHVEVGVAAMPGAPQRGSDDVATPPRAHARTGAAREQQPDHVEMAT